ncbi:MAG: transglutaminase-like domain-containing protein [Acidobacteriota bacterium]|nr:transglutaminase-like domain-containing protein [Acidobacteriota bacterium]
MKDRLLAAMCGDPAVDLDAAALELATFEYPDLDPASSLRILDRIAAEIGARAAADADGAAFVCAANAVLFDEMRFSGNAAEYYDPRNSCLNAVLDRRSGIPITLGVVYMEVARRLGRPVHGIGLPGHFIAQYDDGRYSVWLDPFRGGRLLEREQCQQLAKDSAGVDISGDPDALRPATRQMILVRMANNLRAAYFRAGRFDKVVETTDLLMRLTPLRIIIAFAAWPTCACANWVRLARIWSATSNPRPTPRTAPRWSSSSKPSTAAWQL